MLSQYKSDLNPIINIVSRPFTSIHPNLLTILGLGAPVLFFIAIIHHAYGWALLALILTLLDTIDGAVARKTGRVTAFGGVLDSSIDRISDTLLISSFGFASLVRWEIIISLLAASYLISYLRSRAELAGKGKLKLNIGIMERTERVIFIFIATIIAQFSLISQILGFNFVEAIFIIILILSLITIIQRYYQAFIRLQSFT